MNKKMKLLIMSLVTFLSVLGFSQTVEASDRKYGYAVLDGTKYYESSQNGGSGKTGHIGNSDTKNNGFLYVEVNGYAYVDEHGQILKAEHIEDGEVKIPGWEPSAHYRFYHIRTDKKELGWINSEDVLTVTFDDESSKEGLSAKDAAETIAERLENATETTAFLIDASYYIPSNEMAVLNELCKMDIDAKAKVFCYGTVPYEVNLDLNQITDTQSRELCGGYPDLYEAIKELTVFGEFDEFIVLSSLYTNKGFFWDDMNNIKSFTVFDTNDFNPWDKAFVDDLFEVYPFLKFTKYQIISD